MATLSESPDDAASPICRWSRRKWREASTRLFFRSDLFALCEVPPSQWSPGRHDGDRGEGWQLVIVEIKVSKADLMGDQKWTDYLEYCDHFFWAVPAGFALDPFDGECLGPDCAGLIVADRYDAAVIREAPHRPLAAARRKAETLRFARRARAGDWRETWIRAWRDSISVYSSSLRIAAARRSCRA
jgi:hypothetical protein